MKVLVAISDPRARAIICDCLKRHDIILAASDDARAEGTDGSADADVAVVDMGASHDGPAAPGLPPPDRDPADAGIVAASRAMCHIMEMVDRAAAADAPVLLLGESGTGKELLARALHCRSSRASGPLIAVNCSAIPEALLENELFGHRQGAFTDARRDQEGLFQAAHHGTIFLDEIGDMSPALQGKLLRVLEDKQVHPLGATAPVAVDVRVVTATHRDLDGLVATGRFRHDLLYRINVIDIHLPPLRDRPEDIAPLTSAFLARRQQGSARQAHVALSPAALHALERYPWPGNVRELENVIERALALGGGPVIRLEDLPQTIRTAGRARASAGPARTLADVEREHIMNTLVAVAGNKSAAARVLGLDRKTLYRKLSRVARTG